MENSNGKQHFSIEKEIKTKDEKVKKIKKIGTFSLKLTGAMLVGALGYSSMSSAMYLSEEGLIVSAISCGIAGACLFGKGVRMMDHVYDKYFEEKKDANKKDEINEIGGKQR